MNNSDDATPQWVLSARNNIEKAKREWGLIYQAGQADVRRGLETIKVAEHRLQELNYLERTLGQNLPPTAWNDEIVYVTGTQLGTSISAFQANSHYLAGQFASYEQEKENQHQYLIRAVSITAATSGSTVYLGAAIERRLEAINPAYKPILTTAQPVQIESRLQAYDELANCLQPFDPKYLHMLKGSEEALHGTGTDSLSQAAHSMRDLFQQFIEHLAPADVVKQQAWFQSIPGAPGGVSRLSRLRYILYGAGSTLDERETEQLDEVAERAKNALDLSIARAHDHDPQLTQAEVQLAIDHARFSLLQVLKRYKVRRSWGAA